MVKFYRNLNASRTGSGNHWSVYRGKALSHAPALYACDVSIKQPSGKAFEQCLKGGSRSVFAWMKANRVSTELPAMPGNAQRVRFNPKQGDTCFNINGRRVDTLSQVWLTSAGQCYGIE